MASSPSPYETTLLARFREVRKVARDNSQELIDIGVISEKAPEYVYRALDRQINKARGLLTYNALLFASFNLVTRSSTDKSTLILASAGGMLALLSCLPLLLLMVVDWGKPDKYKDAESDFKSALQTVSRRTRSVKLSLLLSSIATLAALTLSVKFLWTTA